MRKRNKGDPLKQQYDMILQIACQKLPRTIGHFTKGMKENQRVRFHSQYGRFLLHATPALLQLLNEHLMQPTVPHWSVGLETN